MSSAAGATSQTESTTPTVRQLIFDSNRYADTRCSMYAKSASPDGGGGAWTAGAWMPSRLLLIGTDSLGVQALLAMPGRDPVTISFEDSDLSKLSGARLRILKKDQSHAVYLSFGRSEDVRDLFEARARRGGSAADDEAGIATLASPCAEDLRQLVTHLGPAKFEAAFSKGLLQGFYQSQRADPAKATPHAWNKPTLVQKLSELLGASAAPMELGA